MKKTMTKKVFIEKIRGILRNAGFWASPKSDNKIIELAREINYFTSMFYE